MPDAAMTIVCKYSRLPCAVFRSEVQVSSRSDEDVVAWVRATVAAIGAIHRAQYPHCKNHQLDELMIPLAQGSDKVGGVSGH